MKLNEWCDKWFSLYFGIILLVGCIAFVDAQRKLPDELNNGCMNAFQGYNDRVEKQVEEVYTNVFMIKNYNYKMRDYWSTDITGGLVNNVPTPRQLMPLPSL